MAIRHELQGNHNGVIAGLTSGDETVQGAVIRSSKGHGHNHFMLMVIIVK